MSARKYDGTHCIGETSEVHTGHAIGTCKCGATLSIGTANDPLQRDKPTACLMHPMPFCAYYANTDPEQILRDVGATT